LQARPGELVLLERRPLALGELEALGDPLAPRERSGRRPGGGKEADAEVEQGVLPRQKPV